jgi:hypothetical protein
MIRENIGETKFEDLTKNRKRLHKNGVSKMTASGLDGDKSSADRQNSLIKGL